ncbi:MAG: PD-(D/E)XK nuclease family protein [Campylobacterales bacterium]|nr:PD-(D/E)XK nuclease family protein [Campylobacterales bacterium]
MNEEYKTIEDFISDGEVQNLLEQINNNVMDFNVLEITGMGTQEIKHSNILSWMFGDSEHQLGYKILEGFLKKIVEENKDNEFIQDEQKELLKHYIYSPKDNRNLTIYREKNSIDLLLIDENNEIAIAIENKVYANERSDGADGGQLNKYFTYVNSNYANFSKFFIYLTLDNSYPSEGNENNWLVANHQMIGEVVEQLLNRNGINEKTHLILSSYVDLLKRRNIMEDKNLEELCEKIWAKNAKALDILYRYRKTDLDRLYDIMQKDENFDIYDDNSIKTKVHDDLSFSMTGIDKWEDSEKYIIDLLFNKYKDFIWFGYWHPDAKDLIETNDSYKSIYEKLFGKRVTKEHQILRISEEDFYNDNFEELVAKFKQQILSEIERFETIVKEVLEK